VQRIVFPHPARLQGVAPSGPIRCITFTHNRFRGGCNESGRGRDESQAAETARRRQSLLSGQKNRVRQEIEVEFREK
jgi:hypothetical protein